MKNIIKLFILALVFNSCQDFEPVIYDNINGQTGIGFTTVNSSVVVPIEGITTSVAVQTTTISSSARTFNVSVDEDASTGDSGDYTFGSLTIPANSYEGSLDVTFIDDNLVDLVTNTLVLKLDLPPGAAVVGSETTTFSYVKFLICNDLSLVINTDGFGSETTWEITDDMNVVVQSGGPFTDVSGGEALGPFNFTLADGCYTFTIFDSFGDGLFDGNVTGNYALTCSIITHATGGGNFGSSETTDFCVNQ